MLLAVNHNIAVKGHLKGGGNCQYCSRIAVQYCMKAFFEGEVKTRSKISIGMNLHNGYLLGYLLTEGKIIPNVKVSVFFFKDELFIGIIP